MITIIKNFLDFYLKNLLVVDVHSREQSHQDRDTDCDNLQDIQGGNLVIQQGNLLVQTVSGGAIARSTVQCALAESVPGQNHNQNHQNSHQDQKADKLSAEINLSSNIHFLE
jgi:hypothetical protein